MNKLHNHYTGYLPKTKDFFLSGTKIHEKIFDIFDGMFRKTNESRPRKQRLDDQRESNWVNHKPFRINFVKRNKF